MAEPPAGHRRKATARRTVLAAAAAVLLAGYAKGLLDEAGTDGHRLRAAVGECWHRADWLTVRVLAICALSRDDGWRRPLHTAP